MEQKTISKQSQLNVNLVMTVNVLAHHSCTYLFEHGMAMIEINTHIEKFLCIKKSISCSTRNFPSRVPLQESTPIRKPKTTPRLQALTRDTSVVVLFVLCLGV